MPIYEYVHCNTPFSKRVSYDSRDTVSCVVCKHKAQRLMSSFNVGNVTHVADNYKNIEHATGVRNIETHSEAQRALTYTGTEPVEAYYRPPKPPAPKEVTMEELAPYLDNMPLENEPV